jgi:hypothetical protein
MQAFVPTSARLQRFVPASARLQYFLLNPTAHYTMRQAYILQHH